MWRMVTLLWVLAAVLPQPAHAYSVLTHEALIDASWDDGIAPVLTRRFHPSRDALIAARAYAYGGCILQDMGYYPLSSRTFSDLTHYVRAGEFVLTMIRDARNANELAFALGALAHYTADTNGHAVGINPSTPLLFPKLARKFGPVVTYEDSPSSHLRTEFAFDVVQVARGAYLPQSYRDFIGFEVAVDLLERSFVRTYGLELRDVFGNLDMAIGTYRWSVSQFLPALTKAAWETKKGELERVSAGATRERVLFAYSRDQYEEAWGRTYRRPGFHHRLLAFLIRIVPKIGPFKSLAFKAPTPDAERLFLKSFEVVGREYRRRLAEVGRGTFDLPDVNLDTARPARAGDYRMLDGTYAELVTRLNKTRFRHVNAALRQRILAFYAEGIGKTATAHNKSETRRINEGLRALRTFRAPETRH